MSFSRCPHCSVPLTQKESAGKVCPVCGKGLRKSGIVASKDQSVSRISIQNNSSPVKPDSPAPVGPSLPAPFNRVSVTFVGVLNLVFGCLFACLGIGNLLVGGLAAVLYQEGVGRQNPKAFLPTLSGVMAKVGFLLFLIGLAWTIAALGVLYRKKWGRVLMLVFAVPIFLLGLLSLVGGEAISLLFGVVLILNGIFTFVVLLKRGSEFSGTMVSSPNFDPR